MRIRISYRPALYALLAVLTVGLVTGLAGCGGGKQQSQAPTTEEKVEQPESPKEQPTEQPKEEVVEQPEEQKQPEEGAGEQALIDQGKQLATQNGCMGCHSIDGSPGAGPTWKGLFGKEEELTDGTKVKVDEPYLRESIVDPDVKVVKGYSPVMPEYTQFSDEDLKALIAYIKSLSE
jgi:cytochrome c1